MDKFNDDSDYMISGRALNSIWRECYLRLISEGRPLHGNDRRDIAQRLGALLEAQAEEVTLSALDDVKAKFP